MKLCKDCRWCTVQTNVKPGWFFDTVKEEYVCLNPELTTSDYVTGTITPKPCIDLRNGELIYLGFGASMRLPALCGHSGKYFEPLESKTNTSNT